MSPSNAPKFVIVNDDNERLCFPCDTEAEARQAVTSDEPLQFVCRVCPQCGQDDLTYLSTTAYGLEANLWYCLDCEWTSDTE